LTTASVQEVPDDDKGDLIVIKHSSLIRASDGKFAAFTRDKREHSAKQADDSKSQGAFLIHNDLIDPLIAKVHDGRLFLNSYAGITSRLGAYTSELRLERLGNRADRSSEDVLAVLMTEPNSQGKGDRHYLHLVTFVSTVKDQRLPKRFNLSIGKDQSYDEFFGFYDVNTVESLINCAQLPVDYYVLRRILGQTVTMSVFRQGTKFKSCWTGNKPDWFSSAAGSLDQV
jgi:hypothetical protein